MKVNLFTLRLVLGIFVLSVLGCLPEPPVQEEVCNITSVIRSKYNNDATRLALRLQQNSSAQNEVLVSETLIERTMNALSAVYNSSTLERDSVVLQYDIHTLPYPEYDEFRVEVDTNEVWVKEWVQEHSTTGNPTIDNLMTTYSLLLEAFVASGSNYVVLYSIDPINISALVDDFEAVEGVINVQYDSITSGGNDILVEDLGNVVRLTYQVGYDDASTIDNCTGECEKRRSWVFDCSIDEDVCSATFVESFGDAAP